MNHFSYFFFSELNTFFVELKTIALQTTGAPSHFRSKVCIHMANVSISLSLVDVCRFFFSFSFCIFFQFLLSSNLKPLRWTFLFEEYPKLDSHCAMNKSVKIAEKLFCSFIFRFLVGCTINLVN